MVIGILILHLILRVVSVSVFILKMEGGAVSWCSKKQDTVSQSTLEAEFTVIPYAVREAIRVLGLHIETLGNLQSLPRFLKRTRAQ